MPKQSIRTEVTNPCFVQTCKPASLACSIQFSFFLSAWFFVTQKTDQSRSNLLRLRADSFEEISLILPSHTVKERKTRGQKSRSDYQSLIWTLLLLSFPIKSRSTGESLTCRAVHRGGARLPIFEKTSTIFVTFFSIIFKNRQKRCITNGFFAKIISHF